MVKEIQNLDSEKKTGVEIPVEILKSSCNLISEPLTSSFNNCLSTGVFPDEFIKWDPKQIKCIIDSLVFYHASRKYLKSTLKGNSPLS